MDLKCTLCGQTHQLFPRSLAVLDLMAQGRSNPAIADRLNISVKTVENYLNYLTQELACVRQLVDQGAQLRVALVLWRQQHPQPHSPRLPHLSNLSNF